MALLGKFGLNGALNKVLNSGDLDAPEVESALEKLLDNKKDAVEKVIEQIESGPRLHYSISLKLLGRLLDNTTIEPVMEALPRLEKEAQNDIAVLLNTGRRYDPHLLLPYLKEPLSLQISRDMIMAHRQSFTAAKLLKAVARTKPDLWDVIFGLVHARIDDEAFPEARALTKSKNAKLREYATGVIAGYNNPAAVEALQGLLNDHNKEVHLAALRGLTRMEASLPATTISQLMKTMQKEEVPLVKALLSFSKDPRLMTYINQAMFGKNAKLRLFALESLALIANKDNIFQVFQELANKPRETHANVIQVLVEHGGVRFIDAVAALAHDPEKIIRDIAIEAIELSDAQNPKILDLIRQHVADDIDAQIKISFINKLGETRDAAATPALLKVLRTDPKQRVVTLSALEKIADESALADVFEMLADGNADVQRAALACLLKITPKQFAGQIREQLIDNVDKIKEPAVPTLVELVEKITSRYHLPETTAYKNAMETLKKDSADDIDLAMPYAAPASSDPFGAAADNPFGNTGEMDNSIFGTGEISMPEEKAEQAAEDFGIDLQEGEILAKRYKLVREIGRGGYGSVWLVEDTFIKEQLVMKFLHQTLVSDEIAIERFIRELRLARKITHTNIIRLFDYLDLGSVAAISMEYFAGAPLSKIIHEGLMEPKRVVGLVKTISTALETAHQAEVVHRDMKPANILVDENNVVKIVDFGIAAASKHAESRLTRTGTLVGTPTYISPEQIQGKVVDGRTDLYSLGIIMYEMLSGHPPYQAEDPMALVFMHVEGDARRLDEVNPLVSKELANIVHRCIEPDPDNRYQSMAELAKALSQLDLA